MVSTGHSSGGLEPLNTIPRVASTVTVVPLLSKRVADSAFTITGLSSARPTTAACEFSPPLSVTMAEQDLMRGSILLSVCAQQEYHRACKAGQLPLQLSTHRDCRSTAASNADAGDENVAHQLDLQKICGAGNTERNTGSDDAEIAVLHKILASGNVDDMIKEIIGVFLFLPP